MFRVALRGWTRRLWTLQEGLMNPSVFVQFQDGMTSLESLIQNISLGAEIAELRILHNLTTAYGALRGTVRRRQDMLTLLMSLSLSLQNRSTSWASDEPLYLAAFFGQGVGIVW